jgi:hypothetical protein
MKIKNGFFILMLVFVCSCSNDMPKKSDGERSLAQNQLGRTATQSSDNGVLPPVAPYPPPSPIPWIPNFATPPVSSTAPATPTTPPTPATEASLPAPLPTPTPTTPPLPHNPAEPGDKGTPGATPEPSCVPRYQRVTLSAADEWSKSGAYLCRGATYRIVGTIKGQWIDGQTAANLEGWLKSDFRTGVLANLRRVMTCSFFELCACMNKDEEKCSSIGEQEDVTAEESGNIYFFVNDAKGDHLDNKGEAEIAIVPVL